MISPAASDTHLDVVAVRRSPDAPGGETTAVRLLGLLPPHLRCVTEVAEDRVLLRFELDGLSGGGAGVRSAVAAVLADSALRGWRAE
jgi:hypothetical protein